MAALGITDAVANTEPRFQSSIPRCFQIAVLRETEAQGPFCSLVMAVVVVKDVLVFVAFAANLEVVSTVRAACSDEYLLNAHNQMSLAPQFYGSASLMQRAAVM